MTHETPKKFDDGVMADERKAPIGCWLLPLYHDDRVPAFEDERRYCKMPMTDQELVAEYLKVHEDGGSSLSGHHSGMFECLSEEHVSQTVFVWIDGCLAKQVRRGRNKLERMRYLPLVIDEQQSHTHCLFNTMLFEVLRQDKNAVRQAAALAGMVAAIFPNKTAADREWIISEADLLVALTEALVRHKRAVEDTKQRITLEYIAGERRDTLRNGY